jgi:hypothetical protein
LQVDCCKLFNGKFKSESKLPKLHGAWKFEFKEGAYNKVNNELKWRFLHERQEAFFVMENMEHLDTRC